MKSIRVALAGQPNVGKSTLFNSLTGFNQCVANYPGVTVECREGKARHDDRLFDFIDLPGTYSISSFSPEEKIAVDVINDEKPDLIVNIVNSANLEQNLYLTSQLLELNIPLILFLNMSDIAASKGISIDSTLLSKKLGIPVISGAAIKKNGIEDLIHEIINTYDKGTPPRSLNYNSELEADLEKLALSIKYNTGSENPRWDAIRFIEEDTPYKEVDGTINELAEKIKTGIKDRTGSEPSEHFLRERYRIITKFAAECIKQEKVKKKPVTTLLDSIFMSRFTAIPLFFVMIYVLFQIVFTLGDPMMGWIESLFGYISTSVSSLWPDGSDSLLRSVIVDGIIAGTGGVLVFTPNVFLLFMGIAFLEGTGYMSRAAVIMDRYMSKTGLSGKSFIPMVLGFGCNVPAIMSTRIIENKWERFATILSIPFMSCSARLPVYVLLISAFIEDQYRALTLLGIYLTGIAAAMITARTLRSTILKGDENPLLIELSDYTLPSMKSIFMQTWDRGKHFLERAGTVILATSIILWALTAFPRFNPAESSLSEAEAAKMQVEQSYMGRVGKVLEPAVELMGGDWRAGSAFVASMAAKEVFVSQIGILFSLGEVTEEDTTLKQKIKETYSIPAVLAFILFTLLSAPCLATFAIIKAETGQWRWAFFQFAFMTVIAFSFSVILYQAGTFLMKIGV
ncbi:MAG: ferrous iron transport protein B [Spirochaetae bacterium HGW-Spirochaetae-5]|nr:MAG: ferrous iron transport protein B [Spirochaetae bacterium HGW-Spirochaetae-5]